MTTCRAKTSSVFEVQMKTFILVWASIELEQVRTQDF